VAAILFSSCAQDVSNQAPHRNLVGTVWRLKTDGYAVVERFGTPEFVRAGQRKAMERELPGTYDERLIGTREQGVKIVAGYRKGSRIKIERVVRVPGLLAQDQYVPVGVVIADSACPPQGKPMDFGRLYDFPTGQGGQLNGKYAERVK
jgi:hypothetical protein